jgi:hypothetical protein
VLPLRNDKSTFADSRPITVDFCGKVVAVSTLVVISDEWKRVPDFECQTIREMIADLISPFPDKLNGASGNLCTQFRGFQDGEEATVLTGNVFFVIRDKTYPCKCELE